jgi:hypothetical protein
MMNREGGSLLGV